MRVAGLIPGAINDYYEHIFETGVDEMVGVVVPLTVWIGPVVYVLTISWDP
jgi:hypothetical protein